LELVQTLAKLTKKEEKITVSGRFRVGDIRHAVADMSTFANIFGQWTPTPLEKGLAQYLDWYLQQSPVDKTALELSLAEMEQKGLLISKHS
jgi:dTDP-L-rhamnose 4-epimerase